MRKIIFKLLSTFLFMFSWFYYLKFLSDIFYGLPGYYLGDVTIYKFFLIIPIILIITFLLNGIVKNIADLILLSSLHIIYFPLIYLSFPDIGMLGIILLNIITLVIGWKILDNVKVSKKIINLKVLHLNYKFMSLIVIVFVILFIKFFGIRTNINYSYSLYEIRSEFKEGFSGLPVYILILSEYFLIPLCIYFFVKTKSFFLRFMFLIISVFFTVQIFLNSAIKSSLFIIPYLIIGYLLLKNRKVFNFYKFLMFFSICLILFVLIKPGSILGYFGNHSLRRFITSPPQNAYYHLSYTVEHYGWINIGNRKYMGNKVANFYYKTDGNSPSGLFADTFSRFGTLGLFSFPFLFLVFLAILKNATNNLTLAEQFVLFGYYIYVLTNTSFLTSQITYGMFPMLLTTYFLNKKSKLKLGVLAK